MNIKYKVIWRYDWSYSFVLILCNTDTLSLKYRVGVTLLELDDNFSKHITHKMF